MDSITHFALGACMGEAFAGAKLGKKAMLWGATAQSVPDIDFLSSFWMDTSSALLAHRGFTHSILFCLAITPLFALTAEKLHRPHNIKTASWMSFFGTAIMFHILVDAFNSYGVGWLEPFSHMRISFNAIYVADPLYSIWPALSCMALIYLKKRSRNRKKWWRMGIGISSLYLILCIVNKKIIDSDVKSILQKQQIPYSRYFTTPAPLQNCLWYVVAGGDSGYYVGFRSLLDSKKKIDFNYFPRNDFLLLDLRDHEDLIKLIRFSREFYTIEQWNGNLVFNDLRFGQINGWKYPNGKFVFYYYLQHPSQNSFVVQRGRFTGWNWENTLSLFSRISGN